MAMPALKQGGLAITEVAMNLAKSNDIFAPYLRGLFLSGARINAGGADKQDKIVVVVAQVDKIREANVHKWNYRRFAPSARQNYAAFSRMRNATQPWGEGNELQSRRT